MHDSRRAPRWRRPVLIVAVVLAALGIAGYLGWQALMNYFIGSYYRGSYQPIAISAADLRDYPPEAHLADVPWIGGDIQDCQAISLQMIAAQHGIDRPRAHFDFLMAFGYGASEISGMPGFFPASTDPETGMLAAAPYLGLARRYYTTDDRALFLRALRAELAQGRPVRLALDMGALYGYAEFIAHSEVIVGYDAQGFYYYETVCLSPADCQPAMRPSGDRGLYVADDRLAGAVLSQSRRRSYPWQYALTVFAPGPTTHDLGPVWQRLSDAILATPQYGPQTGVAIIERLAGNVKSQGARFDTGAYLTGVEIAARFRRDQAVYLRENFAGDGAVLEAADLLEQAARDYDQALAAMRDGLVDQAEAEQVSAWLQDAAAAERRVGEIFKADL